MISTSRKNALTTMKTETRSAKKHLKFQLNLTVMTICSIQELQHSKLKKVRLLKDLLLTFCIDDKGNIKPRKLKTLLETTEFEDDSGSDGSVDKEFMEADQLTGEELQRRLGLGLEPEVGDVSNSDMDYTDDFTEIQTKNGTTRMYSDGDEKRHKYI